MVSVSDGGDRRNASSTLGFETTAMEMGCVSPLSWIHTATEGVHADRSCETGRQVTVTCRKKHHRRRKGSFLC